MKVSHVHVIDQLNHELQNDRSCTSTIVNNSTKTDISHYKRENYDRIEEHCAPNAANRFAME